MTEPGNPRKPAGPPPARPGRAKLAPYQIFVVVVLAFIQFTVMVDFMVLSPLGAILIPELRITTAQFGLVVSVYAFSAAASGILAAGFADKYDRKRLLLFFYGGFLLGTLLCGIADTYAFLLAARMVTGLFGGVLNAILFAIVADLFAYEQRGQAIGLVQTAFAASQVLGIPVGLELSTRFDWHAPFLLIVGVGAVVGLGIMAFLRPVDAHLEKPREGNPFAHLLRTLSRPDYRWAFAATTLLATGGFMLMPFGSAFATFNLGFPVPDIPEIYLATGVTSLVAGPLLGRAADAVGKYAMFSLGSFLGMAVVIYYCSLGPTPLAWVIAVNAVLFVAITARMISAQAMSSAIPDPQDRGAFMAVNASIQQLSGGLASMAAGLIVVQTASGRLEHYDTLGWVVSIAMLITVALMYRIHRMVQAKLAAAPAGAPPR